MLCVKLNKVFFIVYSHPSKQGFKVSLSRYRKCLLYAFSMLFVPNAMASSEWKRKSTRWAYFQVAHYLKLLSRPLPLFEYLTSNPLKAMPARTRLTVGPLRMDLHKRKKKEYSIMMFSQSFLLSFSVPLHCLSCHKTHLLRQWKPSLDVCYSGKSQSHTTKWESLKWIIQPRRVVREVYAIFIYMLPPKLEIRRCRYA